MTETTTMTADPSRAANVDDKAGALSVLSDMLALTLASFAKADRRRAEDVMETVWRRLDATTLARDISDNDRLYLRSVVDKAEARSGLLAMERTR